jgi:polysaccharide export outer membrane protein
MKGKHIIVLLLLALLVLPSCAYQRAAVVDAPAATADQAELKAPDSQENPVPQQAAVVDAPVVTANKAEGKTPENLPPLEDKKAVASSKKGMEYTIGAGDQLDISVWRDDALTKTLIVLPDGKISFPLVGQIVAAGKTIDQLKQELSEKISPFVPEPILNIEVKQTNSMLIYVIGRVNTPGRFPVNTYVNVLQALSISGGLNPFAKRNKIKIFRNDGDKTHIFNFRYDDVTDGNHLDQNIQVKNGDVIVVP